MTINAKLQADDLCNHHHYPACNLRRSHGLIASMVSLEFITSQVSFSKPDTFELQEQMFQADGMHQTKCESMIQKGTGGSNFCSSTSLFYISKSRTFEVTIFARFLGISLPGVHSITHRVGEYNLSLHTLHWCSGALEKRLALLPFLMLLGSLDL
jgi:hypothetical protein